MAFGAFLCLAGGPALLTRPRPPLSTPLRAAPAPRAAAPLRAPAPSLSLASSLANIGETAIFDNVNMGTQLLRGVRKLGNSASERQRLAKAFEGLGHGLDELIFIAVYLLIVERGLKALWRAGNLAGRVLGGDGVSAEAESATQSAEEANEYRHSLLSALCTPAKLLGWAMLLLWGVDAAFIISKALAGPAPRGAKVPKMPLPSIASTIAYTYVLGRTFSSIKNWWLDTVAGRVLHPPPTLAQRAVARRGSGILLWAVLSLVCAEGLSAATGVQLNSILSFAGVGGIAVGLATKDLLTNLVGGCILFITNPFTEREKITMTNLAQSRVLRVGWYQTVVCGDDEEVQTIPNAKFISNKISNRSRRTHRCMKQSVFLTHACLPDAEALIDELRAELVRMPTIDASRNFRVYVKEVTQTAVEVEVELHFRGNDGTEYRNKRQAALLLISKVVARRGAEFAVLRSLLAERGVAVGVAQPLGGGALPPGVVAGA